jgi:cystathionine beta-lyase/cystathionine gamma-synthase
MTKYLCGHGDALGGVVLGPRKQISKLRREMLVHLGGAMSPFNAWLILRGMATLALRMARVQETAATVAGFLREHRAARCVTYPGLPDHPHHDLACTQMSGFGGMLTFQPRGGMAAAIDMAERLRVFTYATSLGHARSLIFYYPTDLYVDAATYLTPKQKAGIRDWTGSGIFRASVGLEDPQDLVDDLDQALRGRSWRGWAGAAAYGVAKRFL